MPDQVLPFRVDDPGSSPMRIGRDDLSSDPGLLLASISSFRSALMTAPTPYMVFTQKGETVLVNDSFVRGTGYGLADLPDIRACLEKMRRVAHEEMDAVYAGWVRAQSQASSKEITVWTAWDERLVWRIQTSDPVIWPDGRTVIIQSMFDLTEQRRLEDSLRSSEEQMRVRLAELESLYQSAPLGLAMLDRDLNFVRVNDALAEFNGVNAVDHIGRFVFDVVPDVREQVEPMFRRVLSSGEAFRDIEIRCETKRAPGILRDWVEQAYPLKTATGELVGLGLIIEEITDRKLVQRELASTNVALRRTLDLLFLSLRAAGVSVFTQDRDLRYLWIGGDYFGCDPDAAVGAEEKDVVPPELVVPLQLMKREVLETGQAAHKDLPYQKDGKTVWCNVQIEPWRSRNGEVQSLLGAVSDISERKATEQHIRTLLGELAHRSKNLLTVIQVMARRSVSPDLSSSDFVDSFIERLSGLAQSHDLLAREDWRGISMQDLVTSQIGHLNSDLSSRLFTDGPDLVLAPVAAQNLGMAVHELSTNAVKYGSLSVDGGQVHISWSVFSDESGRDRLRLTWVERGGPPVTEPTRRGFGRFVIEAIAARALSGVVDLRFEPDGVCCTIEGAADSTVISQRPLGVETPLA